MNPDLWFIIGYVGIGLVVCACAFAAYSDSGKLDGDDVFASAMGGALWPVMAIVGAVFLASTLIGIALRQIAKLDRRWNGTE